MLLWIAPDVLSMEHLQRLAESLNAAPGFCRMNGKELLTKLHSGQAHAFAFPPKGLLVAEPVTGEDDSRRLMIHAFAGITGATKLRQLADDLKRIGAEWMCDTIETTCFDLRLAHAIQRVGGRTESVCLTLAVKE